MKILLLKKPENAVSHYRGLGVWGPLSRQFPDVTIAHIEAKSITPDIAGCYDWLYSHRPGTEVEINAIYLCWRAGVKIWVDLDDLVWKLPAGNPVQGLYTHGVHTNLHHAMSMAHLVTVSTEFLARETEQAFNVKPVIIRNAWNEHTFRPQPQTPYERDIRVLWRGSNTHDADLMSVASAFQEVENVQFIFMGANPWYFHKSFAGGLEQIQHIPWQPNITAYVDDLYRIRPHFVVVPLADNDFNRAKSNIAQLEAACAGAITIAPSFMPEFAGSVAYTNAYDLIDIFANLTEFLGCYQPPPPERALSQINQLRYELLTSQRLQQSKT